VNWSNVFCMFRMAWPDHQWQCKWQVAWTPSHMCAGKRQTLRATSVTIFSHTRRDVLVFVKCDTIFRLFLGGNYHKFELLISQGSAATCWRYGGKYYYRLCWKFTSLSSSERILKILRIDTVIAMSLVYYFLGHNVEHRQNAAVQQCR